MILCVSFLHDVFCSGEEYLFMMNTDFKCAQIVLLSLAIVIGPARVGVLH